MVGDIQSTFPRVDRFHKRMITTTMHQPNVSLAWVGRLPADTVVSQPGTGPKKKTVGEKHQSRFCGYRLFLHDHSPVRDRQLVAQIDVQTLRAPRNAA